MTTLTVTEARKNLSGWLRRAKAGEEIGIIEGNRIIALRPVEITAVDTIRVEAVQVDEATQRDMNAVAGAWNKRRKGV